MSKKIDSRLGNIVICVIIIFIYTYIHILFGNLAPPDQDFQGKFIPISLFPRLGLGPSTVAYGINVVLYVNKTRIFRNIQNRSQHITRVSLIFVFLVGF